MKKNILLSAAMMLCVMLSAQTQQGYVKTKGRLANDGSVIAGTRIPNATIHVKDRTPVVSQVDGTFSFPIPASKFYLQNVQKQGYVLTDPEVLSKQYFYSANDMIIVMEDLAQREADRRAIERKISGKLYAQLLQQSEELDNLREQNKITEEKYHELLQQLNQYQDDNEKIIKDMADRYAKMDFDQIDEFNRKVSEYILNGELTKADSMLSTKGSIPNRIEQLNKQHEANNQVRVDLEKSESMEQRVREDIANDCYSKFEILKMQHLNDSAAYYLELRLSLDTTNVKWLLDMGSFNMYSLSQYDKAMNYFKKALQFEFFDQDTNYSYVSTAYSGIGTIYLIQTNFDKSLEYYEKALQIEPNPTIIATINSNIGLVYDNLGNFEKSLIHHGKSLEHRINDINASVWDISTSYSNIGMVYFHQGNYSKAMELFQEALNIYENNQDNFDYFFVPILYNNLGGVYLQLKEYDQAIECFKNALNISLSYFGEIHSNTAYSYQNIGGSYLEKGDIESSIEYFEKALNIRTKIYGDSHPSVGSSYSTLGYVYFLQKKYDESLRYQENALEIMLSVYGANHPQTAYVYNNIGLVYQSKKELEEALKYYFKAAEIRLVTLGENHPTLISTYKNIASIYREDEEYEKAIEYENKTLAIQQIVFGEDHQDVMKTKERISKLRAKLKEQE